MPETRLVAIWQIREAAWTHTNPLGHAGLTEAFDAAPSYDELVEKLDERFQDHWWFDAEQFLREMFGIEPPEATDV